MVSLSNHERQCDLEPEITADSEIRFDEPDLPAIVDFLCTEREFSKDRVTAALDRAFRERSLW